jgi:hypothetical protein
MFITGKHMSLFLMNISKKEIKISLENDEDVQNESSSKVKLIAIPLVVNNIVAVAMLAAAVVELSPENFTLYD